MMFVSENIDMGTLDMVLHENSSMENIIRYLMYNMQHNFIHLQHIFGCNGWYVNIHNKGGHKIETIFWLKREHA